MVLTTRRLFKINTLLIQIGISTGNFFLGPYEAGVARYKHMYFNATENTFKMWALTVGCTIVLYECVKNIVRFCLDKQIRYNMAFLFILSMFSHYYSWLAIKNT